MGTTMFRYGNHALAWWFMGCCDTEAPSEQSAVVSGIVCVFMRFMVHDWSWAAEFTNDGGPFGALTNIGL